MKSLLLVSFNPLDPERLKEYGAAAAPTLAEFGAEVILKGPATNLAGSSNYAMRTVIGFESREKADAWYASAAYQAIIPLREKAMDAEFTLIG
jgi:uncharacterized protein (DUF1330 family)